MSHDIDDLLQLIKMLEERIIELESILSSNAAALHDDHYYWNHG